MLSEWADMSAISISSYVGLSPKAARRILYSRFTTNSLDDCECLVEMVRSYSVITSEAIAGSIEASGASPSLRGALASSMRC